MTDQDLADFRRRLAAGEKLQTTSGIAGIRSTQLGGLALPQQTEEP
jgi:hypothetical protein